MFKHNEEFLLKYSKMIKSIAHPVRLFIIMRLKEKDLNIDEIIKETGKSPSCILKHISVLKLLGIISENSENGMTYYMLNTPCLLNFMICMDRLNIVSNRNICNKCSN
jgi:DNA-binding transcriptional ArsR family regulator